ncbi:MAG: histidine phosphatase family protein [Pseudomonadota bacterium]
MNIPKLPFYFIRHGETDWNAEHRIMGQTDIDLNQNGLDQAYTAAYILENIEISKIFASSLRRAYNTAKIISEICGDLEIEKLDAIKERGWGVAEGSTKEQNKAPLSFLTDENLPNNGEKYRDFEKRIISEMRRILLSEYRYPLIVSHGGVFKVLAKILANQSHIKCDNCQMYFFSPPEIDNNWDLTII